MCANGSTIYFGCCACIGRQCFVSVDDRACVCVELCSRVRCVLVCGGTWVHSGVNIRLWVVSLHVTILIA